MTTMCPPLPALLAAGLLLLAQPGLAATAAEPDGPPPAFDTDGLPPLPAPPPATNPFRGHPRAIELGREVFNRVCAPCHGADAMNKGQVGPDLLKMDRACDRIADPATRQLCVADNDQFFLKSVQEGKVRVGVTHMPAWKRHLPPPLIWAIRSFLESRRP